MNDEQADLIDRFAGALDEYSPKKFGGVFAGIEDVLANAMVMSGEDKSARASWQQSSVESLEQNAPSRYLSQSWSERLSRQLVYLEFGRSECLAAGISDEDYQQAIGLVVSELWCQDFHFLVGAFMRAGGNEHSRKTVNRVINERGLRAEGRARREAERAKEQTDDRLDEIIEELLRPVQAW